MTTQPELRSAELEFVIPAHNEARTVGRVVEACAEAGRLLTQNWGVTVVDDCSTDTTFAAASDAGARVIRRDGLPSKAKALTDGVSDSQSPWIYCVDADCVGLTGDHLAQMAEPVLVGRYLMSVGVFDYGPLSGLVQRFPWSSGERLFPRHLFPLDEPRLVGYNVELLINEAVGRENGNTAAFVMSGVRQRTKAHKAGGVEGLRRNIQMWREIARTPVDKAAYHRYMDGISLLSHSREERIQPLVSNCGKVAMRGLGWVLA